MDAYRHDPAATAAVFTNDGWLRTGDIGHVDEDGYVLTCQAVPDTPSVTVHYED